MMVLSTRPHLASAMKRQEQAVELLRVYHHQLHTHKPTASLSSAPQPQNHAFSNLSARIYIQLKPSQ